MNKKIIKVLTILMYVIFIICSVSNVSLALITDGFNGSVDGVEITPIEDILKAVLTVIRSVGVFIAVGILMIVACKYIIASAGDRADIKKHAISYVIGAVILFATSGIAAIIKNLVEKSFE